jgi:t-SNARE complex subunit (syntaxin)
VLFVERLQYHEIQTGNRECNFETGVEEYMTMMRRRKRRRLMMMMMMMMMISIITVMAVVCMKVVPNYT